MTHPRTYPPLPALAALGELRERQAVVLVDTREQDPLPISELPWRRATITTGDYSGAGVESVLAVERKSVPDLVSCCMGDNRERLERELHRLQAYHLARLLVVGTVEDIQQGRYRSNINPTAVLHSLYSWEARYGVPVVFVSTAERAARYVERMVWWATRDQIERSNGIERGTREG